MLFNKYLNKHGSLSLVVMVAIVFIILGAAFVTISISETRQVALQEKRMQAYYIARSGAEATAESIIGSTDDTIRTYLENNISTPVTTTNNSFANGTFDVTATMNNVGEITVTSIGTVSSGLFGDVESIAELTLINLQNRAITTINDLDLDGIKVVQGEVESTHGNVTGTPNTWIDPQGSFSYTYRELPRVTVPSLPLYNGVPDPLDIANNIENLPGSYEYKSISTGPTGVLVCDTTSDDITIVAESIDIKGSLEIIGSHNVYIFITSKFATSEIKTSDTSTNSSDQLFIFLDEGVSLTVKTGSRAFYGHIYGPDATITLWAGADIHGSITGNVFAANGQPSVYHVPLINTPPGYPEFVSSNSRYQRGVWKK